MRLCANDNERTEGLLVRGSLCWPVKELESESTIQTTASSGLPHTLAHKGGGGKTNPFHREVTAPSKASSVCVFPQGGGKTLQASAARQRGFVFDPDA